MASDGYGGGEEQYMYHVPQQSRREKLRYQQEEPPFQLLHPHHPNPAPQFYHTSVASSSSHQNPNAYSYCTAAAPAASLFAHHISTQPFSLTLSSSSSSHAPPPRQQLTEAAGFEQRINPAPLGPFTGYSEILSRSRFLEPARQLLEEISGVGGDQTAGQRMSADRAAEEMAAEGGSRMAVGPVGVEEQQQQWSKTRLISMLDELYRRYKLYYQQIQAVVTSFQSVPGLSSAAPYATMALKLMSKHFRCLKNAISDQIHNMNKSSGKERLGEEENCGFGIINSGGVSPHRPANNFGTIRQPQVWRPQRGLPERAVAVLRAWLFEHFLHPYPTDTDKQILAKQTGLTRNQVSNWFINARVRLWKPMVEEIHSLDMQQKNKSGAGDDVMHPNTHNQAQLPSSSTATSSNDPSNHIAHHNNNQNQSSKQAHQELPQISNHHVEAHNYNQLVYDGFSSHHHTGVGLGGGGSGLDHVKGNGGVSLTLGLHQNNNGLSIMEPIPLNVVRRFGLGLEDCNDAYVISSFEGQDRHFEKDIGGHFLHDFVG